MTKEIIEELIDKTCMTFQVSKEKIVCDLPAFTRKEMRIKQCLMLFIYDEWNLSYNELLEYFHYTKTSRCSISYNIKAAKRFIKNKSDYRFVYEHIKFICGTMNKAVERK